ncbi:hypothetical protein [Rhodoblastus sp.]|uniref:hypothetical protein n=1 Tax=Rhodoblastus sp. TaxID=1962975 RepID=UPI003F970D54
MDGAPSDGCFTDTHHGTSMPLRGAVHPITVTPMMRRAASLHADKAWGKRGEKLQQLPAPDRLGDNHRALRVNRVDLKHVLGEIETNLRDRRQILDRLSHGRRSI